MSRAKVHVVRCLTARTSDRSRSKLVFLINAWSRRPLPPRSPRRVEWALIMRAIKCL